MAKNDTKGKSKSKPATTEQEFEFGVADLAKLLDLEPASVRVKLRNANIKKAGKSYGWDTKAEMQKVADKLASDKPAAAKSKDKGDDKPKAKAPAPKAKAAAPKPKAKK